MPANLEQVRARVASQRTLPPSLYAAMGSAGLYQALCLRSIQQR